MFVFLTPVLTGVFEIARKHTPDLRGATAMLDKLKRTFIELMSSKKAIAALAGVVIASAGRVGLELDAEAVTQILTPIIAYIVGQGLADFGKASAQ